MNWIKEHKGITAGIASGVILIIALVVILTVVKPFGKTPVNSTENGTQIVENETKEKETAGETEPETEITSKEEKTESETELETESETEPETEPETDKDETTEEETKASYEATKAPVVVPTQAPTQAPTQTPTQAPTQAPTQEPTEAPTEAPVVHGKDGKILDTLYLNNKKKGMVMLPESKDEMTAMYDNKPNTAIIIGCDDLDMRYYYPDIFGVGLVFQQSTISDIEAYFGKPLNSIDSEAGLLLQYQYKDTDLYIVFNFFENNTLRMLSVDNDFSDCGL